MKVMFLGRYSPKDPLEVKAHELWEKYEQDCENFDRCTCTGKVIANGEVLPANFEEMMAVSRYAADGRRRVRAEALELGVPEDLLETVRRRYK